jgi:tRNA threonylcarbamoyladenosine biosynthesis protein TsaB
MNLLALETSSVACSVALAAGAQIHERHEERPKAHTRLLIPMIEAVLGEGAVTLGELDAVVLGNGPGSFIGMRIAASVAQGLCYGAGLKLVPVSSLAAVAAEALEKSAAARIAVAQDAHMNEVYLGCYRRGGDAEPVAEGATTLEAVASAAPLARLGDRDWLAAGDGWHRYPELRERHGDRLSGVLDVRWPRARYLLDLGRRSYLAGEAIDAALLVPAYVRERVAA